MNQHGTLSMEYQYTFGDVLYINIVDYEHPRDPEVLKRMAEAFKEEK